MAKRTSAQKAGDSKTAWKLRRRSKYNKDGQKVPKAGDRTRFWVAGFVKADGTKIEGHWRANHYAQKKGNFAKTGVGSRKHAKSKR